MAGIVLSLAVLVGCAGPDGPAASAPETTDAPPAAPADDGFPTRPIELVVPFAVGGGADAMARNLSSVAGRYIDVPVRVVSMPGASGSIAANHVLAAEPDGHTLIVATYGGLLSAPLLDDVGFTLDDWVPVGLLAFPPFLIASNPDLPFDSLDGLIEYSRANPGEVSYASTGAGGSTHFMALLLQEAFGVEWTHVPYDGGSTALLAVMSGETDIGFGTAANVLDPAGEGLVRVLAVTGDERLAVAPDVPTVRELGHDFAFSVWQGVAAPAGTPPASLAVLEDLLASVAADEAFVQLATEKDGVAPELMRSAEATEFLAAERAAAAPAAARIVAGR